MRSAITESDAIHDNPLSPPSTSAPRPTHHATKRLTPQQVLVYQNSSNRSPLLENWSEHGGADEHEPTEI